MHIFFHSNYLNLFCILLYHIVFLPQPNAPTNEDIDDNEDDSFDRDDELYGELNVSVGRNFNFSDGKREEYVSRYLDMYQYIGKTSIVSYFAVIFNIFLLKIAYSLKSICRRMERQPSCCCRGVGISRRR